MIQQSQQDGSLESDEMQKKFYEKGLSMFWSLGKLDIENCITIVVEHVMLQQNISKVCHLCSGRTVTTTTTTV
jgi:hypothetical protein